MGLSTKQVSSDGYGWNQALLQASNLELPNNLLKKQQQQQQEEGDQQQLKCPRCESTNTKFCYYNNYNKSQPRHFCKACRRHWTKGGVLRNVPIGGCRKSKQKPTTKTTSKTSSSNPRKPTNNKKTQQGQQRQLSMAVSSSGVADTDQSFSNKGLNDGVFVGPQDLQCSYSNLGNFEGFSSTISSLQSPSSQVYSGLEETMVNNNMAISSWSSMGVGPTLETNGWAWDDFDKFGSVDDDLITIPWDDHEIKP